MSTVLTDCGHKFSEYEMLVKNLPDWMRKKYLDGFGKKGCWAANNGVVVDRMEYAGDLKQPDN